MVRDFDKSSAGRYVLEELVSTRLEQGRLVRVLEDWCPDHPGFFLYDPSRRQLPVALRAFVDFTRTGRSVHRPERRGGEPEAPREWAWG